MISIFKVLLAILLVAIFLACALGAAALICVITAALTQHNKESNTDTK